MNRLSLLLSGLILLVNTGTSLAQTSQPAEGRHMLYVEGLGSSLIYSLNYEGIIVRKKSFQFSVRAGLGAFPQYFFDFNNNWLSPTLVIPMEPIICIGKKNSRFEASFGYTHFITPNAIDSVNIYESYSAYNGTLSVTLGYRFEKPTGGFFLRTGMVGMYSINFNNSSPMFWLAPNLCIGYKFKRDP